MSICKHCGWIGGNHKSWCKNVPGKKRVSRAATFLTHNERPCTGKHCTECTPSTKTPQHRADDTETESAA